MKCQRVKQEVSAAADSGRELSSRAVRHITHCPQCKKFQRFCRDLSSAEDPEAVFLDGSMDWERFDEKILQTLKQDVPREKHSRSRWFNIPAIAGAGLVGLAAVLLVVTSHPPSTEGWLGVFGGSANDRFHVQKIANDVSSPLYGEILGLEHSIRKASRFLVSKIDLSLRDRRN